MIKVKYFNRTENYESRYGSQCKVIRSPMTIFNEWDQKDVQRIHSINPSYNTNGECVQILVFYDEKETADEQ